MQVYNIGYHENDMYTAYLETGTMFNISIPQENKLKILTTGKPQSKKIITGIKTVSE